MMRKIEKNTLEIKEDIIKLKHDFAEYEQKTCMLEHDIDKLEQSIIDLNVKLKTNIETFNNRLDNLE